jgi:hypothetical protein
MLAGVGNTTQAVPILNEKVDSYNFYGYGNILQKIHLDGIE